MLNKPQQPDSKRSFDPFQALDEQWRKRFLLPPEIAFVFCGRLAKMSDVGRQFGRGPEVRRVDVGTGWRELVDIRRAKIDRHGARAEAVVDFLGDIVLFDRILDREAVIPVELIVRPVEGPDAGL